MDDALLKVLVDRGIPAFAMSSGLTTADFGWGSPTFHKMVGARALLALTVLPLLRRLSPAVAPFYTARPSWL